MFSIKKITYLLIICCFCIACKKENRWDLFKRTGEIITSERALNDFTTLEVNSNFNILIIKDDTNKVTIEAGENLISLIKTDVVDGKLTLQNNNRFNWTRSYSTKINITIHSKNIESILIKEICDIKNMDTIRSENFKIEINHNVVSFVDLTMHCTNFYFIQHSGTGTYHFNGMVDSSNYYLKGTGYIYANNLQEKTAYVVNKSTGDIHVNASVRVNVEYTGSGDVYYAGNPAIIFDQSKSPGQLIKE